MAIHLIELNDHLIRISNQAGVLIESPGYANIANGAPVFGANAQQLSRLHPRQNFNQFWSQLSLDPLANANQFFRHQADLAYGHLNELVNTCGLNEEVIFALPGNYNRNHFAILLGLVGQCPFEAIGLIDKTLLYLANSPDDSALFIDIQLHQTILTTVSRQNDRLVRDKVIPIQGAGLLALYDAWANMITDAFIKQCRFDPQHNAETEQYVYSQLDTWIANTLAGNEVQLEINNKGTVHQALLNRLNFEQRVNNIYSRIQNEIHEIVSPQTSVYIPASMLSMPGLKSSIPGVIGLADSIILENCFDNQKHITSDSDALSFINNLPAKKYEQSQFSPKLLSLPTHILLDHKAYRLSEGTLYIGPTDNITVKNQAGVNFIKTDNPAITEPLIISRQPEGYILQLPEKMSLLINDKTLQNNSLLELGDCINFINSRTSIQLIQVE